MAGIDSFIKKYATGKNIIRAGAVGVSGTWLVNQFSGRDDNYNTIEGFPELGLASQQRKLLTDFGSGYRGQKQQQTEERFSFFEKSLEKYGIKVGTGHKRIIIPKDIISEADLTERLGFVPVHLAIPESDQTSLVSYRNPSNTLHLHEHGDVWTMHKDEYPALTMIFKNWLSGKEKKDPFSMASEFSQGLLHTFTEGVPGAFYYTKGLLSDGKSMKQRLREELPQEYKDIINNRFSGRDDSYNTIQGLRHGGLAQKKRRELTDFGSGYDPIRALAKTMGKNFEDIVESKPFQEALGTGKVLKQLGEGAFGFTELMESSFEGQAFKYVRKTQHEFEKSVDILYKNSLAQNSEITRQEASDFAKKYFGFSREASAQKALSLTETVPSVYKETEKQLYMEAMPGKSILEHYKAGGDLSDQARKALYNTIDEAAQKGIFNPDIHYGNLLFDPESGRTSWIDWGLTQNTSTSAKNISSFMEKKITPLISSRRSYDISSTVNAASTASGRQPLQSKSTRAVGPPAVGTTPVASNNAQNVAFDMTMPQKKNISLPEGGGTQPGLELVPLKKTVSGKKPISIATGIAAPPQDYNVMANFTRPKSQLGDLQATPIVDAALRNDKSIITAINKKKNIIEQETPVINMSGFGETGEAAALRKINTDFGSGYRGLLNSSSKQLATVISGPGRARRKLLSTMSDLKRAQKKIWNSANSGGRNHIKHNNGKNIQQVSSTLGGGL